MNTKQTAIDAHLAHVAAIHAKLECLQQLAGDPFGHDSDAVHWGHVGDLGRAETGLDEFLEIFV
ncbi:MAG: hypothetical protein GJU73_12075 [Ferrovum sp.]|jgi:hypothetical protein|uniref:hypothetical protein n=1 Tax=Ferrovum sp. TaxID=2609467 RepID=UPI00262F374A|nr:hypothetical protein [Ferrovum sp.]MBW8068163.1 hypothetical protein [Ferrovum sp.]